MLRSSGHGGACKELGLCFELLLGDACGVFEVGTGIRLLLFEVRVAEIGAGKVNTLEMGAGKHGARKVRVLEVGAFEVGAIEVGISEIGSSEACAFEFCHGKTCVFKPGFAPVGLRKVGVHKVGLGQHGTFQVCILQAGTLKECGPCSFDGMKVAYRSTHHACESGLGQEV